MTINESKLDQAGLKILFAAAISLGVIAFAVTALAEGALSFAGLLAGLIAFPLAFMALLGLFNEREPA